MTPVTDEETIGLNTGMLAAALGGLDAFVFTAGIGENSVSIRARVAEQLAWLGAVLDPSANAARKSLISQPQSRVGLYVLPTDEELMIARHTLSLSLRRHRQDTIAGDSLVVPSCARFVSGRDLQLPRRHALCQRS